MIGIFNKDNIHNEEQVNQILKESDSFIVKGNYKNIIKLCIDTGKYTEVHIKDKKIKIEQPNLF